MASGPWGASTSSVAGLTACAGSGRSNSLTIQNGGTLTTFTGLVGQSNGRGDVTVTGPGSLWTNFNSLQRGRPTGLHRHAHGRGRWHCQREFFWDAYHRGGWGRRFRSTRGDGTVTSTQINARGFLVPGQAGNARRDAGLWQSRIPVRCLLHRAGQSHDGLDHQGDRQEMDAQFRLAVTIALEAGLEHCATEPSTRYGTLGPGRRLRAPLNQRCIIRDRSLFGFLLRQKRQ